MNLLLGNKHQPSSSCKEYFMIKVHTLPAFSDNYLWLFHSEGSNDAYVVDPGDATVVLEALKDLSLNLAGILITHHHADHTGGIAQLLDTKSVPVYGPNSANIPLISHPFKHGESLELSPELRFEVIEVPGHTLDHIAWFCPANGPQKPLLFCGDTLFAGGCGRLFEGSAAQMHQSLSLLAKLPENTAIHCAHEYTMANLAFAQAVEPNNHSLTQRVIDSQALRDKGLPTVPSTIGLELKTNPFMRCNTESVKNSLETKLGRAINTADELLGAVRTWKDSF